MKNPLEYTLLEVDALLHTDTSEPQSLYVEHHALADIVRYVAQRQRAMEQYKVEKVTQQIQRKDPETMPRRKMRSLEQELLDNAPVEVVTFDQSA